MRDATPPQLPPQLPPQRFNPRVPCGTRLVKCLARRIPGKFQSTRPVRDATYRKGNERRIISFQSTRPVRDATPVAHRGWLFQRVSIHASRAGRDAERQLWACQHLFQSTRPVRDATYINAPTPRSNNVSIHASRAGRDRACIYFTCVGAVSIHASRAGRDQKYLVYCYTSDCFNPRVPCGTRLKESDKDKAYHSVSIHASRAGRDPFLLFSLFS